MSRVLSSRVESRLAQMTLEAKVGQLFLVFFNGPVLSPALEEMITTYRVGGLILYTVAGNLESSDQITTLIAAAQSVACRDGIPLLISVDQEGGPVVRLPTPATHFPSAMAIAATGQPDYARQVALATAVELRSLGINVNYAPVVDVNSNPLNPIIGIRSFGSDPVQVTDYGLAMLQGYQAARVIATPKHFPGHGDTDVDSHLGLPRVDRSQSEVMSIDLAPFKKLVEQGAEIIMTAHVVVPALDPDPIPATLSPRILQTILRDQLGFDGVVITDSLTMGAIVQHYGLAQAAQLSLEAGADILLFGADPGHDPEEAKVAYHHLLELFRSGSLPMSRLDTSVRRILLLKERYGLLEQPVEQVPQLGSLQHQTLALTVARESITLATSTVASFTLDGSVIVIWPQSRGNLGLAVQQAYPLTALCPIELDVTESKIDQILAQVAGYEQIVMGTYDIERHPTQLRLLQMLPPHRVIGIALGSPYDLKQYPYGLASAWVTYGDTDVALQALVECLQGVRVATGHLPVSGIL